MAAVAVEDDADMARPRAAPDAAGQPAGIEIIEEAEHRPQSKRPHNAGFRAFPSRPVSAAGW